MSPTSSDSIVIFRQPIKCINNVQFYQETIVRIRFFNNILQIKCTSRFRTFTTGFGWVTNWPPRSEKTRTRWIITNNTEFILALFALGMTRVVGPWSNAVFITNNGRFKFVNDFNSRIPNPLANSPRSVSEEVWTSFFVAFRTGIYGGTRETTTSDTVNQTGYDYSRWLSWFHHRFKFGFCNGSKSSFWVRTDHGPTASVCFLRSVKELRTDASSQKKKPNDPTVRNAKNCCS